MTTDRRLTDCHACKAMISREAVACPACGQPRTHLLAATAAPTPLADAFALAFWAWMVLAPVGVAAMLWALPGPWLGTLSLGLTGWAAGLAIAWLGRSMA